MKVVTIKLKDQIIEHIIETRHEALFQIKDIEILELFEISHGLFYSFCEELQSLGYIRKLASTGEGIIFFTVSSLDTFYEQGLFEKHYSLKNLLENKLMYEVEKILIDGEKQDSKTILTKVKDLLPSLNTAVTIIDKATKLIE